MHPIATIRQGIRAGMSWFALFLHKLTNGRITPDAVTWVGFLAHFAIGYLIVVGDLVFAAALLFIFGLFDTLDGSLARLQKVDSPRGMFLDASTDRFKEVILYTAVAWYLLDKSEVGLVLSVLACGIALSISYVKAKGESAIALTEGGTHRTINNMFHDGLAAFDIRILLLIVGLLLNQLPIVLGVIAAVGSVTLVQRFVHVYRAL